MCVFVCMVMRTSVPLLPSSELRPCSVCLRLKRFVGGLVRRLWCAVCAQYVSPIQKLKEDRTFLCFHLFINIILPR